MNRKNLLINSLRLLGGRNAEFFIKNLGVDELRSMYYMMLKHNQDKTKLTYYEFGVGYRTLNPFVSALKSYCKDFDKDINLFDTVLFDSFNGLPIEKDYRDKHNLWKEGDFKISKPDIEHLLFFKGLSEFHQVRLIDGFYEDSLTSGLRDTMTSPDIITIDVDYYSSTKTILNWLEPILESGALFFFDDLYAFSGDKKKGELGAINDFNSLAGGQLTPYLPISPRCYIYSKV